MNPYISKLKLTNYRNYKSIQLEFPAAPIALVGVNGVGKTNILEAISILQPGRGIRSARFSNMSYNNKGKFGIFAELISKEEKIEIGTEFEEKISRIRKIKINKSNFISQKELINYLRVLFITPLMDKIFIDPPSSRRKFFDRITWNFYPSHSVLIRAYEKLIKERNNLLKENSSDVLWIENIEKQLVEYGVNIIVNRDKVLNLLIKNLKYRERYKEVFPLANIYVSGELENVYKENAILDNFKKEYLKKLSLSRPSDFLKKTTNIGPHKTDLIVNYKTKNMPAYLCSTGEQKGLLISIVLAAVRSSIDFHGSSPILLLDEVFAHLDESKREALSKEIIELKAQAWMTSTNASHYMTFGKKSCIINLNEP